MAILVLVIFLVWWLWPKSQGQEAVEPQVEQPSVNLQVQKELRNFPPVTEPVTAEVLQDLDVRQVAYAFVERYGSYSTDQLLNNLEELKGEVTPSMAEQLNREMLDRAQKNRATYYGVTTKALSGEVVESSDQLAEVVVSTQQAQYIGGSLEPLLSYPKIEIKLVKDGNQWQIDEANWLSD